MTLAVFDIGGTSVKYGWWQDQELSQKGSFTTPATFEEMIQEMKACIEAFPEVTGVAISAPGAVNVEGRRIDGISAVEYLHHRPIFDQLEQELGLPVTIENDANCAGISEMALGAGKEAQHAAFVVIGTGVGGAVFINRQLYKGSHLFGGEFGLMKPLGERTLSRLGTAVNTAKAFSEEIGTTITGKEMFEKADAGDEKAQQYLNGMFDAIALSLYNVQVSIDPEIIIIGGGISAREDVVTEVKERLFNLLEAEGVGEIMPDVVCCQYQNDANLIGAAANFETIMG